jgi:hypothetical protein
MNHSEEVELDFYDNNFLADFIYTAVELVEL